MQGGCRFDLCLGKQDCACLGAKNPNHKTEAMLWQTPQRWSAFLGSWPLPDVTRTSASTVPSDFLPLLPPLKKTYLFLAAPGLHCSTRAFSGCSEQGLLSSCSTPASHCGAFSGSGGQGLDTWASAVAALHARTLDSSGWAQQCSAQP